MTTYRSNNGLTVQSDLSSERVQELLRRCNGDFARKLADAPHWSESQTAWAHKLALEQQAREQPAAQQQTAPAQPAAKTFKKIAAMFQKAAAAGRAYPKMRFYKGDQVIALSYCGQRSKTPGAVNVTDGRRYPDNVWHGRIGLDGAFTAGRGDATTPAVVEFLAEVDANPAEAINAYGLAAGECCFCGKELTVSTVGYGPICARDYGLPYDSITKKAGRRKKAVAAMVGAEQPPDEGPNYRDFPVNDCYPEDDDQDRAMDAAFARAEQAAEERAFRAEANTDGTWSPAALLAALEGRRNV
jgi:hypothetical protein